jgi:hypothetical protein
MMSTLREATHALYEHFGCDRGMHPYIQSIGEASNTSTIHVYLVRKPMAHEKPIPKLWRGFLVESKVIGRLTIGGPP